MYEFTLYNETLKEESVAFGYSVEDMFRRFPRYRDPEWAILRADYID